MNYQYVIIQAYSDYFKAMTQQTVKRGEAIVRNGLFDCESESVRRFLEKVYKHLPSVHLKKLCLPFLIPRNLPADKPLCFMVMGWHANDVKHYMGAYLRSRYPGCKIVCRFEDIIEKMPYHNFYEYKDHFDMLLTLDERESRKYNIPYYPSWYDECEVPEDAGIEDSDVLFIGRAKDRLQEIVEVFEKLSDAGLKCKFCLVDVPEEKRIHPDRIDYCSYIPYTTVLQYVKKTKCMLEILQKDMESETLRVFEAIQYNKKLITSNRNILTREYYDPQKIFYYEKVQDLDPDFVNCGPEVVYEDKYREMSKPRNMLRFIDNYLSDMN